jgi:hypothetical protein
MDYTYRQYDETFPVILTLTCGDNTVFRAGQEGVKEIRQHYAIGDGDRWFYDVEYVDGRYLCVFVFDFKYVLFGHPAKEEGKEDHAIP